jgi:hypothetical protein
MQAILSVFLLLFIANASYAQPIVLLTDWSKAGDMSYENTTILPVKGSGDYLAHDTVVYFGTWRVSDPNPGRTIMEFDITGVQEPTGDLSEKGMDLQMMWMAVVKAGTVSYALKPNGAFDTILHIEDLQAAVSHYCWLMEYNCDDNNEELPTDTTEEYEWTWEDYKGPEMSEFVIPAILEGLAKKLEYLHAYSGDTMVLGVRRDIKDYPEYKGMLDDAQLKMMDISGDGLLLDKGDYYAYESNATFNLGEMMKVVYAAFSSLANEEEEGKKSAKKKKKKNAEGDIPKEILNMSLGLNMTYHLSKDALLPAVFNMSTTSDLPAEGKNIAPQKVSSYDLFRVIDNR